MLKQEFRDLVNVLDLPRSAWVLIGSVPSHPPANARILVSRNKREGYYGGKRRQFKEVKTLSDGHHVFRLISVKRVRWLKSISLRVLYSNASMRRFECSLANYGGVLP
jgi:hypothetical protein